MSMYVSSIKRRHLAHLPVLLPVPVSILLYVADGAVNPIEVRVPISSLIKKISSSCFGKIEAEATSDYDDEERTIE
jgi:hypothetical protein